MGETVLRSEAPEGERSGAESRPGRRGRGQPERSVPPFAILKTSTGQEVRLELGGLIGRGPNADLQFADPRVSVAHAGVDIRDGHLCLLRYRGRLWVRGARAPDPLRLHSGLVVELASGLWVRVVEVHVPTLVPTLQVGDAPAVLLGHEVWHLDEHGALRWGPSPDRPLIWSTYGRWYVRLPDQPVVELTDGEGVDVEGVRLGFQMQAPADAGGFATRQEDIPPILVRSLFEETVIEVEGRPIVRLHRISHKVIRELGRLTACHEVRAVHWRELAGRVWTPTQDHQKRWESKKSELHDELRRFALPVDLFRTDQGLVQLNLRSCDRFELVDGHLDA